MFHMQTFGVQKWLQQDQLKISDLKYHEVGLQGCSEAVKKLNAFCQTREVQNREDEKETSDKNPSDNFEKVITQACIHDFIESVHAF